MDVGPENRRNIPWNVKLCLGNKIVTDYLCSDNICNSIALHLTPDPAGHVEEERLDDHIDGDDDDGHGDVSGGVDGWLPLYIRKVHLHYEGHADPLVELMGPQNPIFPRAFRTYSLSVEHILVAATPIAWNSVALGLCMCNQHW